MGKFVYPPSTRLIAMMSIPRIRHTLVSTPLVVSNLWAIGRSSLNPTYPIMPEIMAKAKPKNNGLNIDLNVAHANKAPTKRETEKRE